jgi:hypothetical protein
MADHESLDQKEAGDTILPTVVSDVVFELREGFNTDADKAVYYPESSKELRKLWGETVETTFLDECLATFENENPELFAEIMRRSEDDSSEHVAYGRERDKLMYELLSSAAFTYMALRNQISRSQ